MYAELDRIQLERKIRLLTLASLGFKNIGQDLSYTSIGSALQVDPSEVEKWVIDGKPRFIVYDRSTNDWCIVIRAGLLSGKLSQTTQTLHITRSAARTFEREQWLALEKRLVAWKTGLAGVLEVVATARTSSTRRSAGANEVAVAVGSEEKEATALEAGKREVAAV